MSFIANTAPTWVVLATLIKQISVYINIHISKLASYLLYGFRIKITFQLIMSDSICF